MMKFAIIEDQCRDMVVWCVDIIINAHTIMRKQRMRFLVQMSPCLHLLSFFNSLMTQSLLVLPHCLTKNIAVSSFQFTFTHICTPPKQPGLGPHCRPFIPPGRGRAAMVESRVSIPRRMTTVFPSELAKIMITIALTTTSLIMLITLITLTLQALLRHWLTSTISCLAQSYALGSIGACWVRHSAIWS
jgi:hypothetical protein